MHDVLLKLPSILKALLLHCKLTLQLIHDSGVLITAKGLTHAVGIAAAAAAAAAGGVAARTAAT
jgi:hypothetical protein